MSAAATAATAVAEAAPPQLPHLPRAAWRDYQASPATRESPWVRRLLLTVALAFFETPRLELWRPEIAVTFAYHVILPQGAAYALWFSLMQRVPASTLALGTLLVPVFGVIGAVVFLGEQPPAIDLFGFLLILMAVVLDQGVRGWRARGP